MQTADPQLHTHVTVFNSVLTDSGRIGALDLDRLAGRVKELGAVYHANVAARARQLGIETVLDERTGAARLADIPHSVRELFSKRTIEAQEAAREFAARRGIDWDAITAEQKIALLKAGAAETRQAKTETAEGLEQKSDFAVWREQAAAASYRHRSVLRPDQVTPAPAAEQRHEAAYRAALPLLDGELEPPCRAGRPGIARDRGAGIDRRRHRRAARRRHRRRDQRLPRAGRGAGRPAGGAAVGQGGAAARQGALERHDGAAYRPGTRADPAGQDRLARFVGRLCRRRRSTAPPMPSSSATRRSIRPPSNGRPSAR